MFHLGPRPFEAWPRQRDETVSRVHDQDPLGTQAGGHDEVILARAGEPSQRAPRRTVATSSASCTCSAAKAPSSAAVNGARATLPAYTAGTTIDQITRANRKQGIFLDILFLLLTLPKKHRSGRLPAAPPFTTGTIAPFHRLFKPRFPYSPASVTGIPTPQSRSALQVDRVCRRAGGEALRGPEGFLCLDIVGENRRMAFCERGTAMAWSGVL